MVETTIPEWLQNVLDRTQLDSESLKIRYMDGLSPATRGHPLRLSLGSKLTAHIVHPDMNQALLDESGQMIASIFNPSWASSWLTTMQGIMAGIPLRTVMDQSEYDFGTTYERSAYFIYTIRNQVVATAGFYQDILKSDSVYGGLFVVRKDYWATSVVVSVFKHILETIRDYQKVPMLEIFTSDSEENLRVHHFYEKNYFKKLEATFTFRDELQRVYSLSLKSDSPIWRRLARFSR